MPKPGHAWWHLMFHTYGTWLPGDRRGFRNRDHSIHSSGDYKNPPPRGEHKGLNEYAKRISRDEVVMRTPEERLEVCLAIVEQFHQLQFRLMVITVARTHVHMVAELPIVRVEFDHAIRTIKTKSSAALKFKSTPRFWARGCKHVMCRTKEHRDAEFKYVKDRQGRNVCSWAMSDGIIRSV